MGKYGYLLSRSQSVDTFLEDHPPFLYSLHDILISPVLIGIVVVCPLIFRWLLRL